MAGRNRCGFTLTTGANKGKKCNQGKGHDVGDNPTNHKYTPPKARPALDLTAIGANVRKATVTEMRQHRRTRDTGEKSAERRFMDQLVQGAYDVWTESGKSPNWADSEGLLVDVPKAQLVTFKDRVHTSAKGLNYRAAFGTDVPNGDMVTVAIRVTDIPPEEPKANANGETPNANAPAPETVNA